MFSPLHSILLAGFFSLSGSVHADAPIDIGYFLVANYTNGFSKRLDMKIEMKVFDSGKVTKFVIKSQQDAGKPVKRFGLDWIGVQLTGNTVVQNEKIKVRYLDLYDPKTKQLQHSINLNDESVKSYQWTNVPKTMQAGQRVRVGTITEKDQAGKSISSGDVEVFLAKVASGFEFCTIETSKNVETKEEEMSNECEQFDSNKKITGSTIDIRHGNQFVATGTAKIRLK